jgi:hypothetical protein
MSTAEELERLVALRDRGVLSEVEFQAEKARVLGHSSAAAGPSESPPPTEPLSPRPSASSGEPTAPGFVASPLGTPVPPTGSPAATGGEGGQTQGGRVLTGKHVLIGLVILAVIGAGVGLGFALTGKSTAAGASEVFLQPKNAQGQHPFTPNVGTDASVPSTASGALTPTSGSSLASYSGNSVGLYGGTLDQSSCNPQQMITYLEANPSKASAWAAAEGISVTQISTYIGGLTPMTLRYDTRVTNHGYVNGQANAIPEILQAGQAVLVDSHGVPRARCYCGNPLTPPEAVTGTPRYVGAQWSEFSPTTVIVVQQSTTVINNFTLISNTTGQAFTRPSGTSGTSDTPAPTCTGGPSMPGVTACSQACLSCHPVPTPIPTTTTSPPTTTPTTSQLGPPVQADGDKDTNYCITNPPGQAPPVSPDTIPDSAVTVTWTSFTPDVSGTGEAVTASDGSGGFTAVYSSGAGTWQFMSEGNFC